MAAWSSPAGPGSARPGWRVKRRPQRFRWRSTACLVALSAACASTAVMPPSGLKRGFADLMNAYNAQRVGAGTVALGLAEGAYRRALAFAK